MKKILTTLAVSALTVAAFAQGTVQWTGVAGSLIVQTNGTVYSTFASTVGAPAASGTQGNTLGNTAANNAALGYSGYYYALLISSAVSAPTTTAALGSWHATGLTSTNAASSNGRTSQVNPLSNATADGWLPGTSTNLVLVGWSANLGSSWATVLLELQTWPVAQLSIVGPAYFGVSSLGTLVSGTANPGVIVFGSNAGQINNGAGLAMQLNQLAVVPEPGENSPRKADRKSVV